MRDQKQYINSRNKVPIDLTTGANIDHLAPVNWLTYDEANRLALTHGGEVSCIVTDGVFCLDIDHALDDVGNANDISRQLISICVQFPTYIELSRSKTGFHIWGRYTGDFPPHRKKNTPLHIELYSSLRHIVLGEKTSITPVPELTQVGDCSQLFDILVGEYFKSMGEEGSRSLVGWTNEPCEPWVDIDIETRRKRMLDPRRKNPFKNTPGLADLWNLAESDWHTGDKSSFDLSLINHLAFWCRRNHQEMYDFYMESNLAKYRLTEVPCKLDRSVGSDEQGNTIPYLKGTIMKAARECQNVYTPRKAVELTPSADVVVTQDNTASLRVGFQFLSCDQQLEYFKGCYYISQIDRVITPMTTKLLSPASFKRVYGGYIFAMDNEGDKVCDNAENAFLNNRGFNTPMIDGVTFEPSHPPGELIVNEFGEVYYNTYSFPVYERMSGDVSPFLNHIAKLLPVVDDQRIFLSYIASLVQNQGIKFRWWPLLQGVEGNGKSIIINFLKYIIGERYVMETSGDDITRNFNSQLSSCILLVGEEIMLDKKGENKIKPLITNNSVNIEKKGIDVFAQPNVTNGILFTNHKDSVKADMNNGFYSRRYSIMYTAQQTQADKIRDGITNNYFIWLTDWMKNGGYAMVAEFLLTVDIPREYDPVYMLEAPTTSSHDEWVQESKGSYQEEIENAIECNYIGFRGGLIGADNVRSLLKENGRAVGSKMLGVIMKSLGFIKHPNLRKGGLTLDNGIFTTLYCSTDCDTLKLDKDAIKQQYMRLNAVC